ncbi:MAG: hypothetical protein BroJett024_41340 [Alphaproteobacteria bacterium]|nr:MAG: hypothetical protein BroJett024_41340 [Alphaproteobacteria bacterium]
MARETSGGGVATPIEQPGFFARTLAAASYAFTGRFPGWFGPGEPLRPLVPEAERETVAGRQFDYPFGVNLRTTPRAGETVAFAEMRALADNYDLLRLVIETRKDQLAKLEWNIRPKRTGAAEDGRCKQISEFFASPDREHDWDAWLRMLLEDMLVIDAATLYPRMTRGGELYALEPVDGATIKRVVDAHGRTPMPPDPAYQQVLKGMPAIDYTREELVYRPRVVRTAKLYGYSPVEQVIMTTQIAMRRQLSQLEFFTMGTMPDALVSVPKEWTADQIAQFQTYFDAMLEGNTGERRKLRFVPDGTLFKETKPAPLKDEFDEWLARVVCFAFSVSPQPFIREMNRATAETAQDAAMQEGLAPVQLWVKNLVDSMIARFWKAPDLEFRWYEEDTPDPLSQAQVAQIYVAAKVLHPDEVRADLGRAPLTEEQKADMNPPVDEFGLPLDDAAADEGEDDAPPKKGKQAKDDAAAKGAAAPLGKYRRLRPINRERFAIRRARRRLAAATEKVLRRQAKRTADQLVSVMGLRDEAEATKVDEIRTDLRVTETDRILALLAFEDMVDELPDLFGRALAGVAVMGGNEALAQIGLTDRSVEQLMRRNARAWAGARAAEMVGMRRMPDGLLVPNPSARWQITEGTREFLRTQVNAALEEGWSAQRLRSEILDSVAFDGARAMTIARTEIAKADTAGSMEGYRASGIVVGKRWLTAQDEKVSDECRACEDAGQIGLNDKFPSGEDAPPNHPNCRCVVLPVLEGEQE